MRKIQKITPDNVPFSKSLFAHKPHFEEHILLSNE